MLEDGPGDDLVAARGGQGAVVAVEVVGVPGHQVLQHGRVQDGDRGAAL